MYVQCIPPQTGPPPAQRGTRSEGHFACRRRRFRRFVMVHGPILDPCSTHLGLILDPYWALLGSLGALLWALLWAPAARASDELEMCVFPRKMLSARVGSTAQRPSFLQHQHPSSSRCLGNLRSVPPPAQGGTRSEGLLLAAGADFGDL